MPGEMGAREATLLVKSILIPRPIAWVGSIDRRGVPNLAPHSFYTMASEEPPIVLFVSSGRKDTLANVEATGEFTISLVSRRHFEIANQTSANYAPQVDEFAAARVDPEPSRVVTPPRVADSSAVLECRVERVMPIGDGYVVTGEVVHVSVSQDVLETDARGRTLPSASRLDPLSRLGRDEWAALGEIMSAPRPQRPPIP